MRRTRLQLTSRLIAIKATCVLVADSCDSIKFILLCDVREIVWLLRSRRVAISSAVSAYKLTFRTHSADARRRAHYGINLTSMQQRVRALEGVGEKSSTGGDPNPIPPRMNQAATRTIDRSVCRYPVQQWKQKIRRRGPKESKRAGRRCD